MFFKLRYWLFRKINNHMDVINIANINDKESFITCAYIPPRFIERFLNDMNKIKPFKYSIKTTWLTTIISLPREYVEAVRCYINASYSMHDIRTNK